MTLTASVQTTELACGVREAVAACAGVLRDVVGGLDPDAMLASEAPEMWGLFDEVERLGAAGKILISRRVQESRVWKDAGMRSAAEYLALRGGTTREVAREALKTSEQLGKLPLTGTALRRGALSASQAHAIADAAALDPTAETGLVDHAKVASLKELRDECLRRKAAAEPDPNKKRQRTFKERYFRLTTDPEGAWRFSGRGPLDQAGTFSAALNPLIDDQFKKARAEGRRESRDAYADDALQEMARLARAKFYGYDLPNQDNPTSTQDAQRPATSTPSQPSGSQTESRPPRPDPAPRDTARPGNDTGNLGDQPAQEPANHGSGDATRGTHTTTAPGPQLPQDAGTPPTDSRSRPPGHNHHDPTAGTPGGPQPKQAKPEKVPNMAHLGLLRIDLEALHCGQVRNSELCEIAGAGPVSVPAARDLLDQSIIKLLISNNDRIVNVTHIGQGPYAALQIGTRGTPLPEHKPPPTHLALIHVSVEALQRRAMAGDEHCDIDGAGPVSVPAARELLGSSALALVLTHGNAVAEVVHTGRKPTVAQRIALLWTQPECTVSGCPHTFTEIDHRLDWAKTHTTRLDTLDRLCTHHHRLKTHERWALAPGTGKRPLLPPDHPHHPTNQSRPPSTTRTREPQAPRATNPTNRN